MWHWKEKLKTDGDGSHSTSCQKPAVQQNNGGEGGKSAGTQFSDCGGMQGWVDLPQLITEEMEASTCSESLVRRASEPGTATSSSVTAGVDDSVLWTVRSCVTRRDIIAGHVTVAGERERGPVGHVHYIVVIVELFDFNRRLTARRTVAGTCWRPWRHRLSAITTSTESGARENIWSLRGKSRWVRVWGGSCARYPLQSSFIFV